ncbi:hypothetical protein JXA80_09235 [bacterium]|nr:hypothetical protein [candidate division CSSED10-310 bacterium]
MKRFCGWILFLFGWVSTFSVSGGFQYSSEAYVLIGDLDQVWYRYAKFGDPYALAEPLIQKKIADLKNMGYTVQRLDGARADDLKAVLLSSGTRAIVWFGHGDPGSPGSITYHDQDEKKTLVGVATLKEWAAEKWARDRGWNGSGDPDAWLFSTCQTIGQYNQLRAQRDAAKFNMEYGYFHTCHSFDTPDLVNVLMKPDAASQFFGYKGIKIDFDERSVQQAAMISHTIQIGDPSIIEPQRQKALQTAPAASPAPAATTPSPRSIPTPVSTPIATPEPVPTTGRTLPPAERDEKDIGARDSDEADEEDEEIAFVPVTRTARDPKRIPPVPEIPIDPGVPADSQERNKQERNKQERSEQEHSERENNESEDDEDATVPTGMESGEEHGNPSAGGDTEAPVWDSNSDGFDGVYTGALHSGTPLTITITGSSVTSRMDGLTMKGHVDARGHVTASWEGEVGEVENPNPGNHRKEKIIGDFRLEGDISDRLANGTIRIAMGCPAIGESPQITREAWSCTRE